MNILNDRVLKDNEQLSSLLASTKKFIKLNLDLQKQYKSTLIKYMKKVSDCPNEYIDEKKANSFLDFLKSLEKNFDLCNNNISQLNDMQSALNKASKSKDAEALTTFYNNYSPIQDQISENNIEIEKFFNMAVDFFNFSILTNNSKLNGIKNKLSANSSKHNVFSKNAANKPDNNQVDDREYFDNTLIISEMQGKVVLPYNLTELRTILEEHPERYFYVQDIIDENYTIPIKKYRNLSISRFKEAFNLMRKKQNESVINAFNLGMELLLNYNLHPAIITACKNLDELDIYLDCLENNETDKFPCFNIKFEVAPIAVKSKH